MTDPGAASAVSKPGTRRFRLGVAFGLLLLGALGLGAVTCTTTTTVPVQNPTTLGLCTFARACYAVQATGPNQGQCADCTAGPSNCRLVFTPRDPAVFDPMGLDGTWSRPYAAYQSAPGSSPPPPYDPRATDLPVVCGSYTGAKAGELASCAAPETVCVARGPQCEIKTSHCVRKGSSCDTGLPVAPQRRDNGQSFCPFTDDVCCPGAMPPPDMGPGDGGVMDAGPGDARIFG